MRPVLFCVENDRHASVQGKTRVHARKVEGMRNMGSEVSGAKGET